MAHEDKLDALLTRHFHDRADARDRDIRAAARVLATLPHPLPRQRRSWRLWPAALLDWDFAPAWPRVAALAASAILGFAVGVVGPSLDGSDSSSMAAAYSDVGAALSEPEPMTGVFP